jgi:hypothetical protein
MPKYTKAQLVAYHTPTFYGSTAAPPLSSSSVPAAIAKLTDLDSRARATRMFLVACWAAAHSKVDKSPGTLKIFMAPEFYFKAAEGYTEKVSKGVFSRKSGAFGAYSVNTMTNLLEALRTAFTDSGRGTLFNDWLIIPGSIVSDLPSNGKNYSKKGTEFYMNTVPVIKGEKGGHFSFIQKHLVSGIDGPPTTNGVFSNPQSPYAETIRKMKENGVDLDSDRVFEVDGVKFALDVCLDHAQAIAKGRSGFSSWVDIHLVTSCGIELTEDAIIAKANGWAMSVDGINNNSFPRSDCRKITSRTSTKATLAASIWDCSPDSGPIDDRWRANAPALVGNIRGREPMLGNLKIEYPKTVTVFRDGVGTKLPKNQIAYGMFPEEIVFYEPVSPI